MKRVILLLLPSLMLSCAYHSPTYWEWGEWIGPDFADVENELAASFDWSKLPGVITSIDGHRVGKGYKIAKLSRGRHGIEYAYYPAEFGVHPKGAIEIELTQGHSYEFCLKLCFWCRPRKYAVWVADKTTGQVVWGKRQDWPSWYL